MDYEKELSQMIKIIFADCNIENLSSYEKRERIFSYLTDTVSYDFELLEKIREKELDKRNVTLIRNPKQELLDVVFYKKGICNGISQCYKLLLEEVGIHSYCVICDDGTDVKHQLNLVYDKENDVYSFDDVTSVIVKRGTKDQFFDYDMESANKLSQFNRVIFEGRKHFVLPETYVNYILGRDKGISPNIDYLPENIASVKDVIQPKRHKS